MSIVTLSHLPFIPRLVSQSIRNPAGPDPVLQLITSRHEYGIDISHKQL
jgi:hypothetical protein